MAKTKELSEQELAILNDSYPVEDESQRTVFPRFGMLAKDITKETGTGKNKKIEVIQAAGTFFTEKDLGKTDDKGKKVWTREYLDGEEVDVIIAFHRRQLKKYDSSLEKFISSPIFDNGEQVIPLYLDKQVIKRGTQTELQGLYPALTQKGKPTSDLKEVTILYVIYEGELYQMDLSQSSKWEFKTYKRNLNPSSVITTISSVEETFGKNTYRKNLFEIKRKINSEEFKLVNENQTILKNTVKSDEKFYLSNATTETKKLGAGKADDKEDDDDF